MTTQRVGVGGVKKERGMKREREAVHSQDKTIIQLYCQFANLLRNNKEYSHTRIHANWITLSVSQKQTDKIQENDHADRGVSYA